MEKALPPRLDLEFRVREDKFGEGLNLAYYRPDSHNLRELVDDNDFWSIFLIAAKTGAKTVTYKEDIYELRDGPHVGLAYVADCLGPQKKFLKVCYHLKKMNV